MRARIPSRLTQRGWALVGVSGALVIGIILVAQPWAGSPRSTPAPSGTPGAGILATPAPSVAGVRPTPTSIAPGVTAAPPSPLRSLAPTPSPTATATESPPQWAPVAVNPPPAVADLIADQVDAGGVALETTFTLRSLTSEPAMNLVASVASEPIVALTSTPGPDANGRLVGGGPVAPHVAPGCATLGWAPP